MAALSHSQHPRCRVGGLVPRTGNAAGIPLRAGSARERPSALSKDTSDQIVSGRRQFVTDGGRNCEAPRAIDGYLRRQQILSLPKDTAFAATESAARLALVRNNPEGSSVSPRPAKTILVIRSHPENPTLRTIALIVIARRLPSTAVQRQPGDARSHRHRTRLCLTTSMGRSPPISASRHCPRCIQNPARSNRCPPGETSAVEGAPREPRPSEHDPADGQSSGVQTRKRTGKRVGRARHSLNLIACFFSCAACHAGE